MKTLAKPCGTLLVALLSASAVACSGAGAGPTGDDGPSVAAVQAEMVQPTETVSSATARELAADWRAFQRVHAAFESILFVGSEAGKPCLTGSSDAGAYDLSCLPLDSAAVGQLTFEAHGTTTGDGGFQGEVDATLENACVGDACVDARVRVDVVPGDCGALATIAATATVSVDGASDSFSFGIAGGVGRDEFTARIVFFDRDGRTLVVDGTSEAGAQGPYLVSGANQSFECSFVGAGGRCDGPTSFSF